VRRFEITYAKPKKIAGAETGFAGGMERTQEVIEREEVEFTDSFAVFTNAGDDLQDVDIIAIAWEPGMRVQEVRPLTNEELRRRYPSLDDTREVWNEGMLEVCEGLQTFLMSQPDFIRGEYEVGGPQDIWAGFTCDLHDRHTFKRTVFDGKVGVKAQGMVKEKK